MTKLQRRFEERGFVVPEAQYDKFFLLLDLLKIRAKTLNELSSLSAFYFKDPEDYEAKGVKKYFGKPGTGKLLQTFGQRVDEAERFWETPAAIERFVRDFAEMQGVSAAKLIHPLRLALTGKTSSPGIFEVLYILGRDTVKRRIIHALDYMNNLSEGYDN